MIFYFEFLSRKHSANYDKSLEKKSYLPTAQNHILMYQKHIQAYIWPPCLAESSSKFLAQQLSEFLWRSIHFHMEGIETFCGSFLQIPSWTWITPSRKLGFKLCSIVSSMCFLLACLFVKVIDLYIIIYTLFCVCVCYSASVRCWNRKNKNRKCQNTSAFSHLFQLRKKKSVFVVILKDSKSWPK